MSITAMVHVSSRNLLLTFGFTVVAVYYYWLQWSSLIPVLGGDHAAYLMMADRLLPWKYARSIYWFSGENVKGVLDSNRLQIEAKNRFIVSWQKISQVVGENECVYSVDPTWLMLYANRPASLTPMAHTREELIRKATRCRYFYIASHIHPPYLEFYPKEYLNGGRIVFADQMEYGGKESVLGMLIEMPGWAQPGNGIERDEQG